MYFYNLTASFYVISVTYDRYLKCGQQPTFHVFSHWYFRYYLRILYMYVLQTGTWTITQALSASSFPFVLLIPTCPFEPRSLFIFDLGLNFENIDYAFLFYQATLNFVHVTSDRSSYSPLTCLRRIRTDSFPTESIELHFDAKRHLPLIPWRCENNGLQRVYIINLYAYMPRYIPK